MSAEQLPAPGPARLTRLATARRTLALNAPEYGWPALAIVASMAIVAPLVALAGESPAAGYETLVTASFGDSVGMAVMLQYSVPLILVGLGVALPLRMGLFNIGGEGQLLMGALLAVAVGVHLEAIADVPGAFVVALAAAAVGGALIGAVAGALRAWRNINEIITTIMLNFVALLLVQYWVTGPFRDPDLTFAASPRVAQGFVLDSFGDAGYPTAFLVALVVAVVVGCAVHFTRVGWRLHLGGVNPALAERQGVPVGRLQLAALAAGGGLAGIGGGAEALGSQFRIGQEFSPGWGFDAVAIAILARGNMLAVVPYALFFGFLRNGADALQSDLGVPGAIVTMLVGAPVIVVATIVGYRAYRRTRG
jgi:ABC-type uncharacterized transport system permease subunit